MLTSLSYLIISSHFSVFLFFFFNDTATTEIYTLSLHDALPVLPCHCGPWRRQRRARPYAHGSHSIASFADKPEAAGWQHQAALLLFRLRRHKSHRRPRDRLADGGRVVGIVFTAL